MATATKSKKKVSTNIRPLGDKVLVQRDESAEMTESGLYLPEQAKDKPKTGVVVAVGEGALSAETGKRTPMTVGKGDRVIFSSYAGTEVKLGEEELLIMSEDEILAIIG
jgi:chaperonin GroES